MWGKEWSKRKALNKNNKRDKTGTFIENDKKYHRSTFTNDEIVGEESYHIVFVSLNLRWS